MAKKTVEDIQVQGKKVLVRCDFNVPLDENNVITDENRIKGALPTIQYLMEQGRENYTYVRIWDAPRATDLKRNIPSAPVAVRLGQLLGKDSAPG